MFNDIFLVEIIDFFTNIFETKYWPARWYCGEWTDFHGWFYIISNLLIWLAYTSIPILMYFFIRKRKQDIPFLNVAWLYVLFILACGGTHFVDAMLFWFPAYRFSALVLFITAIVSLAAVVSLIKVFPEALNLKTPLQLERVIDERTTDLKHANDSLKKINDDIDNFVYAASHDLKSPATNLEGLLDIMDEKIDDEDVDKKRVLLMMRGSVEKVRETIRDLTNVAKVQRDPYDDVMYVSFENILKKVQKDNKKLIDENNVKFIVEFDKKGINYSEKALYTIFNNLIVNAIKYRSENKPVLVLRTYNENGKTVFLIQDNGMGIDLVKNKERLFRIFDRLHDHTEGSGIGLYMIKRIVEERGGSIQVESELGRGTTFKITL